MVQNKNIIHIEAFLSCTDIFDSMIFYWLGCFSLANIACVLSKYVKNLEGAGTYVYNFKINNIIWKSKLNLHH